MFECRKSVLPTVHIIGAGCDMVLASGERAIIPADEGSEWRTGGMRKTPYSSTGATADRVRPGHQVGRKASGDEVPTKTQEGRITWIRPSSHKRARGGT